MIKRDVTNIWSEEKQSLQTSGQDENRGYKFPSAQNVSKYLVSMENHGELKTRKCITK